MKSLLLGLIISLGSFAALAGPVTEDDLKGYFILTLPDVGYVAQVYVKEDGSYYYRDTSFDGNIMVWPGCKGKAQFIDGVFVGDLNCEKVTGFPGLIEQVVDFSQVTIEELESEEGATVLVTSSALPSDVPILFTAFKQDGSYFPGKDYEE